MQINGNCVQGCKPGFYGFMCEKNCTDQCYSCNKNTGACDVCKTGFYGDECTSTCSSNCVSNSNGQITCNKTNGGCDSGQCQTGFYSPTCMFPCSPNCKNSNCIVTSNTCLDGCVAAYYGPACNNECNPNCASPSCYDNGTCTTNCKPGWYGDLCDIRCNETCVDGQCDRQTGVCNVCSVSPPQTLCRLHGTLCLILCVFDVQSRFQFTNAFSLIILYCFFRVSRTYVL